MLLIAVTALVTASSVGVVLLLTLGVRASEDTSRVAASQVASSHAALRISLQELHTDIVRLSAAPDVIALSRALSNSAQIDTATGDSAEALKDRVAVAFGGVARSGPYQQIRYLDAHGQELVRVTSDGIWSQRVPDAELADRGDRKYFIDGRSILPGTVNLSTLDLIEGDESPLVRMSTPVVDARGAVQGVLVTNINANAFLDTLRAPGVALVDTDGSYLLHSDPARTFGRALGTGIGLSTDYGYDLANRMLASTEGTARLDRRNQVAFGRVDLSLFDTSNTWTFVSTAKRPGLTLAGALWLGGIALVVVGTALLGANSVAKRTTKPIKAIAGAAEEIAAGNLDLRFPETERRDELGSLARAFQRMTESLTDSNQRLVSLNMNLEQLNANLEQRVEERTQALEEEANLRRADLKRLELANRDLESANRELDAFSYSVSHDLRAPLRAIDGFSQTLLRDYEEQLDERGRDRLQRVRGGAQRLGNMIDDILQLSRATRTDINVREVDFSAMTLSIVQELRDGDPERQVEFVLPSHAHVEADPVLLRAVVQNLIHNAWKFSSHHATARIEVSVEASPEHYTVTVKDDGAGFDPQYAEKLFGAFQRLHAPTEFEGSGIGLATVQRIINRHGGRIWAEGAVEQGATFWFTLPRGVAQRKDNAA